jgi:DNA-binding NarL/FixJ family response regulator
MTMTSPIRILVVDDHPVIRQGLVAMLSSQSDFEVVGEAGNGIEVLEKAAELLPDVILLDLDMPEMNGLEALTRLQKVAPESRVLVFTAYGPSERSAKVVQAGAKGYLLKGAPPAEVYRAIRIIQQGGLLLQPVISALYQQKEDHTTIEKLTEREMEVLELLAQGLSNKEIAAQIVVTERTVKFHISAIMGKLGATNRTEAVSIAAQMGLVDLSRR